MKKPMCLLCEKEPQYCTNRLCYACHAGHCTGGGITSDGHHLRQSARKAFLSASLVILAALTLTACGDATAPPLCAWRYTKFRVDVTLDSTGHGHSQSVATDSVRTCPTSTWWR